MVRTDAAGTWSERCALARTAGLCLRRLASLAAGLVLISVMFAGPCRADDPVKGEATFSSSGGYARLVLKLAEDVEFEVFTAGSIIVIRFKRPVDIPVDKLSDAVPDYVGSARRDPDGSAIRLSLQRRVTVNTMTAGERIFVDFLPDSWKGPPPSLPAEIIRELSERARTAERALRLQRATAEARKRPPVRVRASVQPTFVRFVFEMPDGVGVSSVLNEQKLTLMFSTALSFDLADAKIAAPPTIASINQRSDTDSSAVDITLIGDVDVHSFREEKNYVVDVAFQQADKAAAMDTNAPSAPHGSAPAKQAVGAPVAHEKPIKEGAPALQQPERVAPVTSETFAEQAKVAIKPEQAPKVPTAEKAAPAAEHAAPATEQAAAAAEKAPPAAETTAPAPETIAQETPKTALPPEQAHAAATDTPKAASPAREAPATEGAQKTTPVAAAPAVESLANEKPATVDARRDSDGLRVTLSFGTPTPAALFRRADTVWLVFDSSKPMDVAPIREKGGAVIGDVSRLPLEKGQAIRIRLNRPQMPSLEPDDRSSGMNWTIAFADRVVSAPLPLTVVRNISDPALANVTVPLANPGLLHRLVDPDAGDTLFVVTAPPPTRGFIKRQDFVEPSLLESIHGLVVHPNSDDIKAEVGADKVVLGKPGGLTLSWATSPRNARPPPSNRCSTRGWRKNQAETFLPRLDALMAADVAAEPDMRTQARLDLANFYMARGMYEEVHALANLILSETRQGAEEASVMMVHAISSILIGRPDRGLKDLASPVIGNGHDSQLWIPWSSPAPTAPMVLGSTRQRKRSRRCWTASSSTPVSGSSFRSARSRGWPPSTSPNMSSVGDSIPPPAISVSVSIRSAPARVGIQSLFMARNRARRHRRDQRPRRHGLQGSVRGRRRTGDPRCRRIGSAGTGLRAGGRRRLSARHRGRRRRARRRARHGLCPACRRCRSIPDTGKIPRVAAVVGAGRTSQRRLRQGRCSSPPTPHGGC